MKTSFIFSECIRILVPGFFFASLLFFYLKFFFIGNQPITLSTLSQLLLFIFFVIAAGLILYIQESPKKRRAFRENQPSMYLKSLSHTSSITALTDEEATLVYFYILNTIIPERFHEKILFFGTTYFIIIQLRRLSLWFGIIATTTTIVQILTYGFFSQSLPAILFTIIMWLFYLIIVRYNKAERKIQEIYRDQIFWLTMNRSTVTEILKQFSQTKGS